MRGRTSALAVLLVLAAGSARAERGVFLEEEVVRSEAEGAPSRHVSRTWLVPGRMRKENGADGSITILRDDLKKIWVVQPRDRSYYELDRDLLDELGRMGMSALLHAKEEDPAKWLQKTGRERRIGGYQTYEVAATDRPLPGTRISLWLSAEVPIDPALRKVLSGDLFGATNPGAQLLQGLRSLEGFPVEIDLSVRIGARLLEIRQTLKRVEALDVPAAQFEVPEGLTRSESPFGGPAAPPPASR